MKKFLKILGKYLLNILISIDQLINTLAGGDPDETISSRLGKFYKNSFLVKILNWIDSNHCKDSIEEDEGKDRIIDGFRLEPTKPEFKKPKEDLVEEDKQKDIIYK